MQASLILGCVVLFLVAVQLLRSPWLKGVDGEHRVHASLCKHLTKNDYKILRDVTLPVGDGTTQIDHVIVSRFGVFVVETKNMKGWIFGGASQRKWTQSLRGYKSQFQNPLHQNHKHVQTIRELLGLETRKVMNIVVFAGTAIPKTQMPENVVWGTGSLVALILSKRTELISDENVSNLTKKIEESRLSANIVTNYRHVAHLKKKHAARKESAKLRSIEVCPICRSGLVGRIDPLSGEQFLGCVRHPQCKGRRALP